MASISVKDLVKQLKNQEYSPVYYFYGKDIMTIEKYTMGLAKKLLPDGDDTYNLHTFNGKELDLGELAEVAESLPMFAEYVCILINDLNAESLSADDLKYLMGIVDGLSDGTVMIFYNTGIDVCDGKKFPTAKNKKLIDAVSKKGTVVDFAYKTQGELVKEITAKAQKNGCDISRGNAEYIIALCLSSTMMINNELDKLTAYVGNGEITREAIDALVPRQLDSSVFDLSRAVVQFNTRRALELLDELFVQRAEPLSALGAISMAFVDLYRAKLAISRGVSQSQVIEDFGYKANRRFAVENAFRDVSRVSVEHLRRCVRILSQTDVALKSTRTDGKLLIEKAIVEMSTRR
ncbi:MAG: DNA polymerase III subunit delta [Ruminococcus sp.]|nr:DNA polymerase III subunit delta [Ruminococcus sp.]